MGALGTIAGGLLALFIGKRMKEPFLAFAGVPVMLIGTAAGCVSF